MATEQEHLGFKRSILVLVSLVVTLLLAEIAYRCKLRFFEKDPPPTYIVTSDSAYQYSPEFGYAYVPNMVTDLALIEKGYPVQCDRGAVNALGNFGLVRGSYEAAQVKVLVFGDSFSVTEHNDVTWPDLLQDELQTRLGKTVNVLNFGRDRCGVLQMFHLAAEMVKKHKPDVIIIPFITHDLTRARFWNTVEAVNGEKRLFTMTSASEPADPSQSVDTHMINPRLTKEWCESLLSSRRPDDPFLQELNGQYRRLEKEYLPQVNFLSLSSSFLFNRIVYRNPYHDFSPLRTRPKLSIDLTSFVADDQFVKDAAALNQSGVPYYLVHIPEYPDLKAKQYTLNNQDKALLESLRRLSNKREISLVEYNTSSDGDLLKLFLLPHDRHPSAEGNAFYARAVADALIQQGLR